MYSQAVTHPSTNIAQCCLTSVIGRELVCSTWYGRRQDDRGNFGKTTNRSKVESKKCDVGSGERQSGLENFWSAPRVDSESDQSCQMAPTHPGPALRVSRWSTLCWLVGKWADHGGTAMPSQPVKKPEQAPELFPLTKISLISKEAHGHRIRY